jgi:hypothetical protein
MTDLSVRVSGGFGTDYPQMSDSLRAKIAAADAQDAAAAERAERAHRARWELAHERAVDQAARELAAEAGIPLREALRSVGHTKSEFVELISAKQDLEDAQRAARARQQLRHAGIDPDSGEPLEVPQPSELSVAGAARMMRPGESPEAVGRGVRARWLRRRYRVME